MTSAYIFFQLLTHSYPVHDRHHNITHNDVRNTMQSLLHTLLTVYRCLHIKIIRKRFNNIIEDILIVFYYQ